MDITSQLSGLVDLGLTRYEAGAYVALIGRQEATPADVARIASIPRQRAYDVLASLAERGVVVQVPGSGVRYRAQPPDRVAQLLLAVRRRELDRLTQRTDDVVDELLARHRAAQGGDDRSDHVEVLRDREHAVERIEQLWSEARTEILSLVRPPYLAPPEPEDVRVVEGVVQRAIYERSLFDDAVMAAVVRAYADRGEQVRVADELPLKLTLVDGRSVGFNMPHAVDGAGAATTVVVYHEALAATLKLAFEVLWQQATPLDA
ncbi:sugar-specific transcriptional regulator TrmB [Haloactinopolyspora alba]|uniref:Sugar-specific transcriptional regulator TrmB n=1 Tax=Haloactinopolyspora alba TaxID=648780 RepID=A0A2P8E0Z5_9ACTN|nr:helix-turn-helix domain-containing protein [Haloactinopolyspora alba]PSL03146.1 sugar-specific transcriptional regulator TrmB [Haloactinopolyspora alba]